MEPTWALVLISTLIQIAGCAPQKTDVFQNIQQEETHYVKEGSPGPTLKCSVKQPYTDGSRYEVNWARYHKGIYLISRGDRLLERDFYELLTDSTGNHDLRLKDVVRQYVEGSYQCTVFDIDTGIQTQGAPIQIIALVAPGEPIIVDSPSESLTEGESVTVKCSSTGGSPPPDFSWSLPNGTLADPKLFNTISKDGNSESTLHVRVRSEDNGKLIICSVTNRALEGQPPREAQTPRLDVLFKPRVHVAPVEQLSVESGEQVTLECQAEANPAPPSFEWKHLLSGERYVASKWPLIAERNMSGEFECQARNSVGDGSKKLRLDVQYGPIISAKERVNPSEGERVEIECHVDANPHITEMKWLGPDGFVSEGPILLINSVTREHSGNYTCTATNHLNLYGKVGSQERSGRAVTYIDVKRRPGKAVITPSTLNVLVGEDIELSCSATDPGSPIAQYKWASPSSGGQFGTKEHDAAEIVIRSAQLADNGIYRCRPFNRLGDGEEAVISVTVIDPASVSRPLATERIYSAEETAAELECEAKGFPAPTITWTKDGMPVVGKRYKMKNTVAPNSCSANDFCSQSVTGSLIFTNAIQWSDKGNFSCIANNGAEDQSTWTVVRVIHGPVVLNQLFASEALAAADIGTIAELRCIVSARPEPTFSWLFNSAIVEETGRYSFQLNRLYDRPDEFEHILRIAEMTSTDYGAYKCKATNGKGDKAEVVVRLRETGPPGIPDSVQKITSTPNSILVGWRPGFAGGFEQTFIIEYRSMNAFTKNYETEDVATIEIRNASRIEEIKKDGTVSWINVYNLTSLKPFTKYHFRIRASNKKGVSDFSSVVIATTMDVKDDPTLPAPRSLNFDITRRSIETDPPAAADICTLLYVSDGDTWSASECYPSNLPISDIIGGKQFKARFCSRQNPLRCSRQTSVLEAGAMQSSWRLALIVPVAVLAFLVLLVCSIFIICCRTKSPKKTKKSPATISAMPQMEAKNTIVHGSQTDSGVFTLDSSRLKVANIIQTTHTYSSSSEETAVENWPAEQYDVSNDPYLNEPATHIFQGMHHDEHMEENSVSGEDEDDGRRVMREIIV